ncbi:MAG: immune inhibitor A domain-containing protein [Sedimentibacter sp.]|uniref:immune inhibitor A domain-containing protein n=1 Tax=Sedimentibacter sp. TaxID=1960295 RepID=UPI0031594B96
MKFKQFCTLALAVAMTISMSSAAYASSSIGLDEISKVQKKDNLPDPFTTRQLELKERAIKAKLNGKAAGKVHEVAKGEYVELKREGDGAIWTVLGEFKDLPHNSLQEPDRTIDNTTIWESDFSRDYYVDLLFSEEPGANSMRNFYKEQSSGRYAVHGDVTDWIMVPNKASDYNDSPDSNVWKFLVDSVNGWYNQQLASGKTVEQINAYLKDFDVKDRYDYDNDGNFDEPDGYIDTFQSVHAGEGEEAGGGKLGSKAIWSHSWYAYSNLEGIAGPANNMLGGFQIGKSDFWIGKYTIQPENGGVGVFTHEYAHDMGLPDLYDYYGENGWGFWTLMASGSWLSDGTSDIGSKPSHMGAWEKLQLGWLNYDVASAGRTSKYTLGPMEFNTKQTQGLIVKLPEKTVTMNIGTPSAGSMFYYGGSGDDLDNLMYKSFAINSGDKLAAMVNYQIELDWDYAYLVASTDGTNWEAITTNKSTTTNPNGQNKGYGITGDSGGWTLLTADLSKYAGQTVQIGFRYWTDGATHEKGILIDEIQVGGNAADGAEVEEGWTMGGFIRTAGTEESLFAHYYIAEYRTYEGYDSTLQVGPYYFGYNKKLSNYVDRFAYQDGLLISYWDTSQTDNDTGLHPGKGLILPIDANYTPLKRIDGLVWRNRVQSYDATFSLQDTDGIPNIHVNGVLSPVGKLPAVKMFDDNTRYYDIANPLGSVMNPSTGTRISVIEELKTQFPYITIEVSAPKY